MEGVRVIDLSRVLAGPTVTRLMVELGAEVIKVETPSGDPSRNLPYLKNDRSGYFIQQNRGKECVCLDLRSHEGLNVLNSLLEHADVLVENFRPGVLDDLGLGWPALQDINPRLILCSVTALGHGGPLSKRPGYDTIGAAYSGVASVSGPPDGPPMMPSAAIGDVTTGVHGFAGVAAALFNRERTGRGDWVQVSLLDTYFHCHEINIQAFTGSDGAVVPRPSGGRHPTVCPAGLFACGPGYVFIACVSPGDWGRLCSAMERPELAQDPAYADNEARVTNADAVHALIEDWLAAAGDPHTAAERLSDHGVASAPILTVAEAIVHPHNLQRRAVRTVDDERWGQITIPGLPIRFANHPDELILDTHELGQDNEAVLARLLDLGSDEITDLYEVGALYATAQAVTTSQGERT